MTDIAENFDTGNWEFNADVVDVFPEHVRASVPFYDQIQDLVTKISDWYLPAGGVIADLGASTGTTVARIIDRHPERHLTAHLYDEQQLMLDRAEKNLTGKPATIEYHPQRIQDPPLKHDAADMTLALFTLQFLPHHERATSLIWARQAARGTGVLLVAEKIRPVDSRWAEIANDCSHDWKADHGISDTAIRAKAQALRGVLLPTTEPALRDIITSAGWQPPEVLFRWHSWVVMGAHTKPN